MMRNLLALVEKMPTRGTFTVRDAAEAAGLAYSSSSAWLKALQGCGWVERSLDDSLYPPRFRWKLRKRVVAVGRAAYSRGEKMAKVNRACVGFPEVTGPMKELEATFVETEKILASIR